MSKDLPEFVKELISTETPERQEFLLTAFKKMDYLLDNMEDFIDKCLLEINYLSAEEVKLRGEKFANYLTKMQLIQESLTSDFENS